MDAPESACLVIADISGYTDYLAGVELDHAHDILADLMNVVVDGLRPPFTLAKLEGDAAFVFAASEFLDGSMVQDTIESTYFRFRRRLRDIHHATTCECNACILIPRLDLKFVAHHGQVVRHTIAEREELVGRDVILVHRLLKNTADQRLGGHPYALYTDACVTELKIPAKAQGLTPHTETIDIIGEVNVWVRDLEAAWQTSESAHRGAISAEDAFRKITFEFDAPRPIVWEFMTDPRRRPIWGTGVDEVIETTRESLRRGAGTTNHCMHGKNVWLEEILDWRPNEQLTARTTFPDARLPKGVKTDVLTDLPGGRTKLDIRLGKPETPEDYAAWEAALPFLSKDLAAGFENLGVLVRDEAERRRVASATEPELPESTGRFISEPVKGHARHEHGH